jgi:hypothetical protein
MRGRTLVLFAAIALLAAPAFAQCAGGACASTQAPFRRKLIPIVPSARAYVAGVPTYGGAGRPGYVEPVGPYFRHDLALIRGPLGVVWYGRSRFTPVQSPKRYHTAPAGVESGKAK